MISEKMNSLMNEQMHREFESAYLYLSIASHFESKGLCGYANWYKIQSQEETDHAMRFYDYLHIHGGKISFKEFKIKDVEFKDCKEPLRESLVQEKFITECIEKIYNEAINEHDYASQVFLMWFIQEQEEEEKEAESQIQNLEMYGSSPAGLYLLDRENSKRCYHPCEKLQ